LIARKREDHLVPAGANYASATVPRYSGRIISFKVLNGATLASGFAVNITAGSGGTCVCLPGTQGTTNTAAAPAVDGNTAREFDIVLNEQAGTYRVYG
jgi:hypothetical protein